MIKLTILVLFVLEYILVVSAKLPSYIIPCRRSDPNFRKCCIENGNKALPYLLKGDKSIKLPILNPIKFPKIDVETGPNLKITLTDISVLGFDTATVQDVEIDFDKKYIIITIHCDVNQLIGHYDVNGKILILPITGNGLANITIHDNVFKYKISYKLEKRGDFECIKLDRAGEHIDFTIKKGYFQLDNLFNGNKALSDNVNKFLNDNQHDVLKEGGKAISKTVRAIAFTVSEAVVSNTPFNQLFLA